MRPIAAVLSFVLLAVGSLGASTAHASTSLITNGDFTNGITGWNGTCASWGGSDPQSCTPGTVVANGFQINSGWDGTSNPYGWINQTVKATSNSMVTGTVIPIGDHNAGGGIWVTLYLLDNSGKQLGSLNTYLREDGFVPVNSDTAFSTPAPWTVGGGPQQFTFDIASMIKADLTGVNAADVAEITVQLEDYLGYQGVFSNISVVSTQAPPTDISVSVPSVSPTDPLAGTNVTFGADMHTFALTDTPDVKLQIGVPAGLGYVSCQASSASSSGAGVVSAPCAFDSSTGQVTASFDTLGVGREGTLSVVASIPSSTAGGTSLMVTDHVAAANNRNALTSSSTVFKVGIDSGVIDPGQGDGQPPVGATPELDSLLLLGSVPAAWARTR